MKYALIKNDFWKFLKDKNIEKQEIEKTISESNDIVEYCERMTAGNDYWQISEDEIRVIFTVINFYNPSVVIETGVGPGVSTTAILSAINKRGMLISIDPGIPYGKGDKEIGFAIPAALKTNFKLVRGKSQEKIDEVLRSIEKVDVFFHDSEHTYNNIMFELNSVWPKLSKNYLIMVDNYDWTDAPKDFANERGLAIINPADDLAFIFQPGK